MALDATLGGPSANSFQTLAEADARAAERTHLAAYKAADDPAKTTALLTAAALMTYAFRWDGLLKDDDQALPWPRTNVYDPDGRYIEDNEIPPAVLEAQLLLADFVLRADRTKEPALLGKGIDSIKVGPIAITAAKALGTSPTAPFPPAVLDLLAPYGVPARTAGGPGFSQGRVRR